MNTKEAREHIARLRTEFPEAFANGKGWETLADVLESIAREALSEVDKLRGERDEARDAQQNEHELVCEKCEALVEQMRTVHTALQHNKHLFLELQRLRDEISRLKRWNWTPNGASANPQGELVFFADLSKLLDEEKKK